MLCYFGHHKCASTWIITILFDVCNYLGLKIVDQQAKQLADVGEFLTDSKADFYVSQSTDYLKIANIEDLKAFHVIRDPRDLIVSAYYSHLHSHPIGAWNELANHRSELKRENNENGLLMEMEFCREFIEEIRNWDYGNPQILEMKMEEMVARPFESFLGIFKFLDLYSKKNEGVSAFYASSYRNKVLRKFGMDMSTGERGISQKQLLFLIEKYSFEKLSGGRGRGQVDVTSHYRSGVSGDWRTHFNARHRERFKTLFGDIVVQLGYEDDNNW